MPSYCPPHGQYYGHSSPIPTVVSVKPVVSVRPIVSKSTAKVSIRPSHALSSTRYFDAGYPTRVFGNRLGKGYANRPHIYGKYFAVIV